MSLSRFFFKFRRVQLFSGAFRIMLCLFLFNSTMLAQRPTFNKKGLFNVQKKEKLYLDSVGVTFEQAKPSEEEIKVMRQWLLDRVNLTLLNLTDKNLVAQYDKIWGIGFALGFKKELEGLKEYLKGRATSQIFTVVPDTSVISTLVFGANLFNDAKALLSPEDTAAKELRLIKNYPLKKWLFGRYVSQYNSDRSLRGIEMNETYLDTWRKLEGMYETVLEELAELRHMDSSLLFDEGRIDAINQHARAIDVDNSPVASFVKGSSLIKKWLWYTGGAVVINPLLATSPDLVYPKSEKNKFITPSLVAWQDSVNKSGLLTDFGQTSTIYNKVLLPIKVCSDKKGDIYLVQYNADSNYRYIGKDLEILEDIKKKGKERYKIAVHNVRKDKIVTYSEGNVVDLKDESPAITAINEITAQIGSIVTVTQPNLAAIGNITGIINGQSLNGIQTRFDRHGVLDSAANVDKESITSTNKKMHSLSSTMKSITFGPEAKFLEEEVSSIKVGDVTILLTKEDLIEDKRRIIWASQIVPAYQSTVSHDFFAKIVEQFLKSDKYYFLDYSTSATMTKTAKDLRDRFHRYKQRIVKLQEQLVDVSKKLDAKRKEIDVFLRITNRSLPPNPTDLEEYTDSTAPTYHSKIFTPNLPEGSKKFNYVLTEKAAKDGSGEKVIARQTNKITKSHVVDASVGLAYNLGEFTTVSQSGTALPDASLGDRLQFIAGLHWYLLKPLNKLHLGFKPYWQERLSLYGGLSIKNALDNYYLGVSVDPAPGFRVIFGGHFYRDYRFKVVNNQVAEKATGITTAGLFFSVNLEPYSILQAVGLFK